jgi:hypothetical protein
VIKESKIMEEIHKIRAEFYRNTRGKSKEYILKQIKEDSEKIKKDLEIVKPDPKLIMKEKYTIPEVNSMEEIHQIRERSERYVK